MKNLGANIGFICVGAFFLLIFLSFIRDFIMISKLKKEQEAYRAMISKQNDDTVSKYLSVLPAANRCDTNLKIHIMGGNIYEGESLDARNLRQSQGYQIIQQSPNVSDQAKEQLKNALISSGVPIQ